MTFVLRPVYWLLTLAYGLWHMNRRQSAEWTEVGKKGKAAPRKTPSRTPAKAEAAPALTASTSSSSVSVGSQVPQPVATRAWKNSELTVGEQFMTDFLVCRYVTC
jgi:hypothetical protein